MINSDTCEEACLLCQNTQDCKVNYSAFHGLCCQHRVPLGNILECIRCNNSVRIIEYLLTPKTNEVLEAANTAIARNNHDTLAMRLMDLTKHSKAFHVKVELLCCECKQAGVSFKVCEKHGYCHECVQKINIDKECQICSYEVCHCGFRGKKLNSVCNKLYCDTCLTVLSESGYILQCPDCRSFREKEERDCTYCNIPMAQVFDPIKFMADMYGNVVGIYNYFK